MCDCNMTSYWDGITCATRLAPNVSCSYVYQCQANLTCIVNETSIGIFSDVCRCPLGSYYVAGSGCVPSKNYTVPCAGSYQCYELAPLSCRFNDTGLTCLDSSVNPLPACDCSDNYYFNTTSQLCLPFLNQNDACTDTCQCSQPYECISSICQCTNFYSSIYQTCVQYLTYGDQCSNSTQCSATPNALMICKNGGTCGCNSTGFWDGSQCRFTLNFRGVCTSNSNCFTGLVCTNISCIGSNSRCSCPANTYFSSSHHNCTSCNGSVGIYTRYVINYPTSDLCVAVFLPPNSRSDSLACTEADSSCDSLTPMLNGTTPQLISVHNQTELNCIASALNSASVSTTCSANKFFYIGFTSINSTFYDGTPYSPTFLSPPLPPLPSQCLTYCYSSNSIGTLVFNSCTSTTGNTRYGAICDYRVF
jgi:hypothetical protein